MGLEVEGIQLSGKEARGAGEDRVIEPLPLSPRILRSSRGQSCLGSLETSQVHSLDFEGRFSVSSARGAVTAPDGAVLELLFRSAENVTRRATAWFSSIEKKPGRNLPLTTFTSTLHAPPTPVLLIYFRGVVYLKPCVELVPVA